METLKNIGFFVLCFAVGAGLMLMAGHFWKKTTPEKPTTGVGAAPAWRGFELPARDTDPSSIKQFTAMHATAVAIEYPQDPHQLKNAAAAAHAAGLKVVLMPAPPQPATQDPARTSDPAPAFSPRDPYPSPLEQVAAEAQAADVDAWCVSWLDHDPDEKYWRPAVASLRKLYAGKVILAMTSDVAPAITMWDAVDDLGIIGPVRLPRRLPGADSSYTLNDARVLWADKLDEWESIGTRYGKGVVLLHMRIMPDEGSLLPAPGETTGKPPPSETAVRQTFYEALLTETKGRSDTVGLFLPWRDNGAQLPPQLLARIESLWGSNEKVPPALAAETQAGADDLGG